MDFNDTKQSVKEIEALYGLLSDSEGVPGRVAPATSYDGLVEALRESQGDSSLEERVRDYKIDPNDRLGAWHLRKLERRLARKLKKGKKKLHHKTKAKRRREYEHKYCFEKGDSWSRFEGYKRTNWTIWRIEFDEWLEILDFVWNKYQMNLEDVDPRRVRFRKSGGKWLEFGNARVIEILERANGSASERERELFSWDEYSLWKMGAIQF